MTERWPKVLSLILLAVLILIVVAYVHQGVEIKTLRQSSAQTLQTLQQQTHLIVDLRKELAKESFRNFESEQALRDWTNRWVVTRMPIVIEFFDTSFTLRGETYSMYQDCDDFAEAMQRDALRDCYLLSIAPLNKDGMIYGVKVSEFGNHAGTLAMTDNAYWYIEPQTGQLVRITGRD